MTNATRATASNEIRGLCLYVNPADPTGPMLHTLAEVAEATKELTKDSETSPNTEPQKTKRKPNKKKP